MKNVLLAVVLILILGGAIYYGLQGDTGEGPDSTPTASLNEQSGSRTNIGESADNFGTGRERTIEINRADPDDDDDDYYEDIRSATEVYSDAKAAMEAIKKGAVDYDDIILEQFVELGPECQWCDEFYKELKEALFEGELNEDERAYYSEVLAISGRLENIQALVEGIQNTEPGDNQDILAESLELTIANDDTVQYLSGYLSDDNEVLQEAVVAAITNQGSRLSAELLYDHTVEKGDPDGYYDIGIGLGELVPDDDALPYLQELALKRDQYSNLAVKALLNSGMDGLQIVMDVLTGSKDPEADRALIKDGIDHVIYEEEIQEYLENIVKNQPNTLVSEFAQEILDDFELEDYGDYEDYDEDYEVKTEAAE